MKTRVYQGPNLVVPYAAVVAEFEIPDEPLTLSSSTISATITELVAEKVAGHVVVPEGDVPFEGCLAHITRALHHLPGPYLLPIEAERVKDGTARLVVGIYDPQATLEACRVADGITRAIWRGAGIEKTAIRRLAAMMDSHQPDHIERAIMRAARNQGIPVYSAAPGSRTLQYGQGVFGWTFLEAGNHQDSVTGFFLARSKRASNQLILRLGYPGVEHEVATNSAHAAQIAERLGYPVVVKPISLGKGIGVAANIGNGRELQTALKKASPHAKGGLLIEKHILGDTYRLTVISGKLQWAIVRVPPRIVGDGVSTVSELIDMENSNRSGTDVAEGLVKRLSVDEDMQTVIVKQGLSLTARPEAGREVRLRATANNATGSTLVDCSDLVHPDNREMAEAVARCFRLNAIGIDFITADVATSWRDIDCGIIEVNTTPGFASDGRAEIVLTNKFPPDQDGRIPSVVLVAADDALFETCLALAQRHADCVGQTTGNDTALNGVRRFAGAETLPTRVQALVLDPSCEALVISASTHDIEAHGFPLDHCDLAILADPGSIPRDLVTLIETCSSDVVRATDSAGSIDRSIEAVFMREASQDRLSIVDL